MAGKPVKVAFLADTSDLKRSLAQAETAMDGAADEAVESGRRMEKAFDGVGEGADGVGSATSQAAGGIGDIAGALEATGLVSEGTAAAMETSAAAIQGVTGAADIANLAFDKLKIGTLAHSVASKVAAAGQWILNAAMSANPIMIVVIAVIALIAIVIVLAKKNEWVAAKLTAAWDWIKNKATAVWSGIKDRFSSLVDWFGTMPAKITAKISGLWSGFKDGFRSMLNTIIGWWNDLEFTMTVPDWIPGIGGKSMTWKSPNIPMLANGGIVTSPTLAIIGEAGPEAVVPLNGSHGFGGNVTVNLHVPVTANPVAVGREVRKVLDAYTRAGGRATA